jgi:hypothetical protein
MERNIDWAAVRRAALDCLNATWKMVCFAEWSQGSDYDVKRAGLHLAAIDEAGDTFRRAMEVLQPGCEFAADDSIRYSPVFDALALATVGEGARPDFRFGPVCCATAHEAAFELLRRALLWVENGLNDELDEEGLPDEYVAGINDLHKLSPEELRDTLTRLERRESLQKLVHGAETHRIRAWIDREWASVSHTTCLEKQPLAPKPQDAFREVRELVNNELRGGQRRLVEVLLEEGRVPIGDVGIKADIRDANRTKAHVNEKLLVIGWEIGQHDNEWLLRRV